MGRPRKRPNATSRSTQDPAAAVVEDADQNLVNTEFDAAKLDGNVMDVDPDSFIDPSLAGNGDFSISDMSFLDFLDSDFMVNQPFNLDMPTMETPKNPMSWTTNLPGAEVNNNSGDPGGSTSLNTPSLSSQGTSPSQHDQQPSPSSSLAPPEALQSTTCSCLADLYLALDSIARLPTQVVPALRTARTAAHTAHNTIRCELCCPPIHKSMKMAPSAFQNTMLLGALLPSIADAYYRILELIDAEATRAIATHTHLTFNLAEYGGTWGELSSSFGPVDDKTLAHNETKVMDPAAWRRSVRSLLKIDVYGVNNNNCRGETAAAAARFHQIGLRDLVAEMDEKSRGRHAEIDALIEAGLSAPTGLNGLQASHSRGKEPHCRHVVELAREAVDNLHIA